jgi:hypothetical protein
MVPSFRNSSSFLADHIKQRIVQRLQIRVDLFFQVARKSPDARLLQQPDGSG